MQNSYWLIAKSLLLNSKLSLLKLDVTEAKKTLSRAQILAEEKSYSNLAYTLSNELDVLLQD